MKKLILLTITLFFIISISGCSPQYKKYDLQIFDYFDTIINVGIYESNEEKAQNYLKYIKDNFEKLNNDFDKYKTYENKNNLKTINDNAGIQPIKVDDNLFNIIEYSINANKNISNKVNIALGPIIELWNKYREAYDNGKTEDEIIKKFGSLIPTDKELNNLRQFTNINDIILDKKNKTVFLKKKGMNIDLGAIAKGYATHLIVNDLKKMGLKSGIINAGGNVEIIGEPKDKQYFSIGIQNPDYIEDNSKNKLLVKLNLNDTSVITSGNYQRYFKIKNKIYCHIIDPDTLKPGNLYKSLSIISKDGALGDYLSTSLFLTSKDDLFKIAKKFKVDVIYEDIYGNINYTERIKKLVN